MKTIDLTYPVSNEIINEAKTNEKMIFSGHVGTHFDVMNKNFPMTYTELPGVAFDVSNISLENDIICEDIALDAVRRHDFVAFHTGFIEKTGYGNKEYFLKHPQLSLSLINWLLDMEVSIIGIDFAGVRRGAEHTPTDRLCAERNVFIVENMCNLSTLLEGESYRRCIFGTYPVNFIGQTGLLCRVVGRI